MFDFMQRVFTRPAPFEVYGAGDLWTDGYISSKMLELHLNEDIDAASRKITFIENSVNWLSEKFSICDNTEIIDFGCGPGLYTTRLAKRNAHVTGVDFSENSLRYAKKTAIDNELSINHVLQNYLSYEASDRFDLVMMIMCDFCVLSPEQRKIMIEKFQKILKPGGHVVLDAYTMNAFCQREESASFGSNFMDSFWSSGEYFGICNVFKYDQEKVILDKYTIIEKERTRVFYNWLQYYEPSGIAGEFESAGFEIDGIYGDVAGSELNEDSCEFAIVAKKRKT